MRKVTMSQLIHLLGKPLTSEGMDGSEVLCLQCSLQIPRGGGISMKQKQELTNRFYKLGLPAGILSLPVQYTNGEYTDMGSKEDATFLSQGLATVFHPDFYQGTVPMIQEFKPHRPLVDGYLDFKGEKILTDYINPDTEDFDRALDYKNSLWIGGLAEDNAEELIREHIQQFSRLYKIRNFLREPEKSLVERSFSAYYL